MYYEKIYLSIINLKYIQIKKFDLLNIMSVNVTWFWGEEKSKVNKLTLKVSMCKNYNQTFKSNNFALQFVFNVALFSTGVETEQILASYNNTT